MTMKTHRSSLVCREPPSSSPADWLWRRASTDPAPATPRSRSATPCRTAARLRAYGAIGKAEAAYFNMINEQGGINGRKINFITRDDGYSPPKTVELVRKLVEQDQVLASVQYARHAAQHRDPGLPQRQQGAATLRRHRRQQMERSEEPSLDDRLAAQLPHRGAHLRPLHSQEPAERQDRACSIRTTISARTT